MTLGATDKRVEQDVHALRPAAQDELDHLTVTDAQQPTVSAYAQPGISSPWIDCGVVGQRLKTVDPSASRAERFYAADDRKDRSCRPKMMSERYRTGSTQG
jgi:hypothetical protein